MRAAGPRLLPLTRVATGEVTLIWNAVAGTTYRVQSRPDLGAGTWEDVAGDVTATSDSAVKSDVGAMGAPRRFYRVLVVADR